MKDYSGMNRRGNKERRCKICGKVFLERTDRVKAGYGLTCSRECGAKSASLKLSRSGSPAWKKTPGHRRLHERVRALKVPSKFCSTCGRESQLELANVSGFYLDVNDFKWQCRRCHMHEDGRILNLINQGALRNDSK